MSGLQPRALITGITGQDGTWLSRVLKTQGYRVFGLVRRVPKEPLNYEPIVGDIMSYDGILGALKLSKPDEVYNLAGLTHVGRSYGDPDLTYRVTGLGAANVFRAVWEYQRLARWTIKVYQASSSEMFGKTTALVQSEKTPFAPISPYACAKVFAHNVASMYRKMGMKIWCGILFNHESEFRPTSFVTTKIAQAAARGIHIQLGNLEAIRDWGYAPEYVEGMWSMLQNAPPDDYVLATGESHSVKEFMEYAYTLVNRDPKHYITFADQEVRPIEAGPLCGDFQKAHDTFGWYPKVLFKDLVELLVDYFSR